MKHAESIATSFFTAAKTGKDAFADLAKNMGKTMIDALAEILHQMGISYIAQGLAEEAATYGASGEQRIVGGGLLEAAAGVMKGAASVFLADGGIATKPTRAIIGEGGEPEAVLPLSKLGAMMGGGMGGDTYHISAPIHLPSVRKPEDFASPAARRTIQRVLSEQIQGLKDRTGLRLQAGLS